MDRFNKILLHHNFKEYLRRIATLEETRVFCKHEMTHFLDVARICYILNLENKANLDKEIIYACSILHDIGRWKEYQEGIDHAIASKGLALDILKDCGFDQREIKLICDAIGHHRTESNHPSNLSEFIYRADKLSRPCNSCNSIDKCNRFENGEIPTINY
ncbi:HD domain-containing protein [Alkalibaculum sp. M08DMB]|uniref:HD domain-containing protein n=1 Tax=Alkalibaculum sporogenes TaxID=2655001 RepID=A0A6A7K6G8_9FIRM|nr:HD domain-containing protein [Alkalibaculum sporogenes]MPW25079.1 HD domain-containing protein [Alkalibaculum sporogenes]